MKKDDNFNYEIDEEFDYTFDEKQGGNSFLAARKVKWGSGDFRLDIRKWFINNEGKEIPGKGITFMDEENGTNNLIKVLLNNNYGKTKDVLCSIKDREDFQYSLDVVQGKIKEEEESNETYYDPREDLI